MPTVTSLPTWVPRLIATLVVAVLTLTLIGLALVLPALPRMVSASENLPAAAAVVDGAPTTLEQVERIDGNVALVTPPVLEAVGQIPQLTTQLDALLIKADQLHSDVGSLQQTAKPLNASAAELVRVAKQVEELRSVIEQLVTFGKPIEQLASATVPILEELRQLNESAAVLASLVDVMKSLDEHISNLDRKTGPVLLPDLGE